MTLPAWVRRGAFAVCVDDEWLDIVGEPSVGQLPKKDEAYLISGWGSLGEKDYLIFFSSEVDSSLYQVDAFRPATQEEADLALFRHLAGKVTASEMPELEAAV